MAVSESRHPIRDSLALGALGVVYGDIGTSPIYTMNIIFSRGTGIPITDANVLGVLSLIFWALLLVVGVKYMLFVLKADHQGDGGVIALATLLSRVKHERACRYMIPGIIASALLVGDAMLTPAISVLSSVQGLELISTRLAAWVPLLTVLILIVLFAIQRRGTSAIGGLFGPVMLVWFLVIGFFGLLWIPREPAVLTAINPAHAIAFFAANGWPGFVILGSVFLVVTGSEALYADLGHFGRAPIRRTWIGLAWPALMLSYLGQGALLLSHPGHPVNTFFALFPGHWLIPLILLATLSTVIASQAVITGTYSLFKQLTKLNYYPYLHVRHTSARQAGQIYVASANWLLMIGSLLLVLIFRSPDRLANAYGLAIGGVSLITSVLFLLYYRGVLGRNRLQTAALAVLFLSVDGAFLAALLTKLLSGALLILGVSGALLAVMLIWRWGRNRVKEKHEALTPRITDFLATEEVASAERVPGTAIFLSKSASHVPMSLVQNFRHNRVLHRNIYLLCLKTEDSPRVRLEDKLSISKRGAGFFVVTFRTGYMETPHFDNIAAMLAQNGHPIDTERLSIFFSRNRFTYDETSQPRKWRAKFYAFMERNSPSSGSQIDAPAEALIEIGVQHAL